jgi:hypothetical protein
MKKTILSIMMLICGVIGASAQAEIKFEKMSHNFGTFSESSVVTCNFNFTNVGDQPLVINQAVASCGCTQVPEYPKTPIKPGEKGTIKVTYNGTGKFPGHFKKSITVRTNGKVEMTRLYIEGDMEEKK